MISEAEIGHSPPLPLTMERNFMTTAREVGSGVVR
jgi:hypothetical protein